MKKSNSAQKWNLKHIRMRGAQDSIQAFEQLFLTWNNC